MSDKLEITEPNPIMLYQKMVRIMGAMETFHHDARHQQGYSYISAEQVASKIRKLLVENNIAFFAEVDSYDRHEHAYVVRFIYTFACADSGAVKECPWYGEAFHTSKKGHPDDKALNKLATVAQKYFLLKTFLAATEDDEDGDRNVNREYRKEKRPQPNGTHAGIKLDDNGYAPGDIVAHVKKVDDTGTRHSFKVVPLGTVTAFGNTKVRELFIKTGWIDENDWDVPDVQHHFEEDPIPAFFEPSGEKWWDLKGVSPHPELPADDEDSG